jgi:hypothetical protein
MTARFSLIPVKKRRGHRPRLQSIQRGRAVQLSSRVESFTSWRQWLDADDRVAVLIAQPQAGKRSGLVHFDVPHIGVER